MEMELDPSAPILVVDDDPKIVSLVRTYLEREGFRVATAGDGRAALSAVAAKPPRLIVLDLMLPELDGLALLRIVRERSDVPVVMLSAKGSVADRVYGIHEGADDYLAKPFSPAELVVRVKAVLRRAADRHDRQPEGGNLVYVLDAGLNGFVSGFSIEGGALAPIAGSTRTLGLANTNPPFFLTSPAQVGFTPDGRHLMVTTKLNGTVDVFGVEADGRLSTQPTRNREGPVPFAFVFDPAGLLTLVTAGNSSAGTFRVDQGGSLTPVGAPVSDGRAAACWIVTAREFDYVANTATGDVSQFRVSGDGSVTLVDATAASGIPGAIDMATAEGRYLYVESGSSGSVDAFAIGLKGSLTLIQSLAVPDGGRLEGIVAG